MFRFDVKKREDAAIALAAWGWLEKLKPLARPDEPVVVICRSGNRTKAVSQFLSQQAGYAKVYNVKSGIKGWIASGSAVVPAKQTIAICSPGKTC